MPRKAFLLGIDLDVHAVSCPGVWLCPKGDTMLRISMLGTSVHTKRVEPNFPLLLHESFHFRKTFTGITSLAGLQSELTKRIVHIQLVQWQVHGCRCVLLATFHSPLLELLYPQPHSKGLMAGVDIDLLMETTPCFPGIIAPKVEVSTKVLIEEIVNNSSQDNNSSVVVNHKTLSSKRTVSKRQDKPGGKNKTKNERIKVRQRPVCHTRPTTKCYNCKERVSRAGKQCGCGVDKGPVIGIKEDDTLYIPHCNKCRNIVEDIEKEQETVLPKEGCAEKWETTCPCIEPQGPKSACECSLCHKYYSLFKDSRPDSSLTHGPKLPKWRFGHFPLLCKDQCCQCISEKTGYEPSRIRAGASLSKLGYPCVCSSTVTNSLEGNGITVEDQNFKDEEYKNIFLADLDSHYTKLYERISRRNNPCRKN